MKSTRRVQTRIPERVGDANSGSGLSLNDLQIPVRPLLNRDQEWQAGGRIQSLLSRLAILLPLHPEGYQKFLARMADVSNGGGLMFTWMSLREQMASDLSKAKKQLAKSHKSLKRSSKSAISNFEAGVKILRTYRLDPETLFQWAKEVVVAAREDDELFAVERYQKIARLLSRNVELLEQQREILVLPNFRLVLKDVFRYHPTGMRRSDLFQEGVLGLQKAAFRYDPSRGTRFSTYATYWIRQSIRKALIDKARMIRVPQAVQEDLRKADPSAKPDEAARVRRIMSETVMFSAGDSDDGSDRNSFAIADSHRNALDETLHTDQIPKIVTKALESLDGRSREVLKRRFGLSGDQPQTLEEIGKFLSLSRERIRQIEREALDSMSHSVNLKEAFADLEESAPALISKN